MTSEYGTIEIDWQPVIKSNGEPVVSKDGTPIVQSPSMMLTPKLQGQYGGWAFEDLDGFWTYQGAPTDIVQNVESEVVLSLGGRNATGKRYQNISRIKAAGVAGVTGQAAQAGFQSSNSPAPTAPLSGDGRNESIREQAFFNNLNPDILAQLPAEQQEALLVAYFDTGMLMLRDSVRVRALAKLNESDEFEIPDTPMVNAAVEAGGVVVGVANVGKKSGVPAQVFTGKITTAPAEDVEELPWG
tara:strand:+ start:293 stop:1021 length:729 start_codon:yes stop_codon:yes gene_type:complete